MTARYLVGDVRDVLATLPDASVDLVASSPPFLSLRSYLRADHPTKDREIGSEATPADYLDTLLDVAEACDRVLAPHGSLAFELGDTYAGSGGAGGDYDSGGMRDGQERFNGTAAKARAHAEKPRWRNPGANGRASMVDAAAGGHHFGGNGWCLDKGLCLIPSLFAASLAYGRNLLHPERATHPWRVRNLVCWARPNPPVGALADKCRPATSYITIATHARDRYWDMTAVRTEHKADPARYTGNGYTKGSPSGIAGNESMPGNPNGAPLKDYWLIPTEPTSIAHFATWPTEIARRLILLMCPERVCRECGKPSRRIVEASTATGPTLRVHEPDGRHRASPTRIGGDDDHAHANRTTTGWTDCGHDDYRRGVVLDPFGGSGTTGAVASQLGRDSISIDLNEEYAAIARKRVQAWGVLEVTDRDGGREAAAQVAML